MRTFKNINARSLVTLFVLFAFVTIMVTSILMFSNKYDSSIALTHTVVGFALILVVFLHIKNNFSALKNHSKVNIKNKRKKTNMALPMVTVLSFVLIILSFNKMPPMLFIYEWGNALRADDKKTVGEELTYTVVDRRAADNQGPTITVDLREGPYFAWPQYAIWAEDMEGNFIQPIFVTSKLAKNNFVNQVTKVNDDIVFTSHVFLSGDVDLKTTFSSGVFPETKNDRARPESLPVFLHKNRDVSQSDSLIPDGDNAIVDAFSGATMTQSFLLTSTLKEEIATPFKIRLEINNSFDFNDYYSSDRFPDDAVYSGNGYSAQPSLIYEAIVENGSNTTVFPMKLIGRGHHSGQDGEIYTDLKNMTTALELIDRVLIEVN